MGRKVDQVLFRGETEKETELKFFFTERRFAEDYGDVSEYKVELKNAFDVLEDEDIKELLKEEKVVEDPYEGVEYGTLEEIEESGLIAMDSWELFEPHMNWMKVQGYDGLVVFEGGVENVVCFYGESYKKREEGR